MMAETETLNVILALIFCIDLVCAELSITVSNSTCGGSVNLYQVQTLHLNYYGAEIGDPSKFTYTKDKSCLYNVSLSSSEEYEMCVYLKLKKHQSPWDLACIKSLKVFTEKFYNVYMPSRYTCSDFKPLCTSERNIYLLFSHVPSLHILQRDVSIELDVYFQRKATTTTVSMQTTVVPSWTENELNSTLGFLSTRIIIIVITCVLVACCCGCCYFQCCCRDNRNAQTQSQDVNNQHEVDNTESVRMLQTAPTLVVYPPPENNSTAGAYGEPPDYYSVCPNGFRPDDGKTRNTMPYNTSGFEEEKVTPSAPPPPYPGI